MPPKVSPGGTPGEWLRRAKGNLALAKQHKPREAYWEDLCFEAIGFRKTCGRQTTYLNMLSRRDIPVRLSLSLEANTEKRWS
jgi:hypothetical protein